MSQATHNNVTLFVKDEDRTMSAIRRVAIDGDNSKLKQVMRNLLSNALKFTPSGGTVEVTAELLDKSFGSIMEVRKCLRIEVTDSGHGISKENQGKLFKQIIQFSPGKLQNGGGSGLGLWSKWIYVCLNALYAHCLIVCCLVFVFVSVCSNAVDN